MLVSTERLHLNLRNRNYKFNLKILHCLNSFYGILLVTTSNILMTHRILYAKDLFMVC
jgi:hypothetical protein